jgi:hypothetical protein
MKRGMVAVLFLVLLSPATWGVTHWYRYQGTMTWNWRRITGEPGHDSEDVYVLLCYETTPESISFENLNGGVYWSGEFDRAETKFHFRGSGQGGKESLVGRGSFNAKGTTFNLQGSTFYRVPFDPSYFGQLRFRGTYLDYITKP